MKDIPKSTAKLDKIVEFYLHSNAFRRLKHNTQKSYELRLDLALNTPVEGKRLGAYRCKTLKVRHFTQAYEHWVTFSGVHAANYRKAVLSAAWRNAMRYDVMTHNPISLVRTVATKPRRVVWSREQVRTFLDTAYSDFRWRNMGLIVHMAYDWGQRIGDMRSLTWDKLDLDQCRMDLTQSKRNAEIHLPISNGLCTMLRQQKEQFGFQEYVAPKPEPTAGAYRAYRLEEIAPIINKILKQANLPLELTAMDLRRTAVTEMMEGGVDLAGIMQVTGHRSVQSVQPYMVNTFSGASRALAARGNDDDEE